MTPGRPHELTALGYIARIDNPALAASPEHGADPKDKVGIINAVNRINYFASSRTNAPRQSRCCRKRSPKTLTSPYSISFMADATWRLGLRKSCSRVEQGGQLDPGFTHAEMLLGRAWMETEASHEATTAFEDVVKGGTLQCGSAHFSDRPLPRRNGCRMRSESAELCWRYTGQLRRELQSRPSVGGHGRF